jgi:hypothetical protein
MPNPIRPAARIRTLLPGGCVSAVLSALLAACASSAPDNASAPINPDWRLVPEATVLGEDRQFFLYGRRLDSVTVTVPPSVIAEQGAAGSQGRVRSFRFKVRPLAKDSLAKGEAVGEREVRVRTPDTSLVFKIKVIDEAHPR